MRGRCAALLAIAVVTALGIRADGQTSPRYPPQFPRPGATKLFENDRIVVWDQVWAKGEPTPVHEHFQDTVSVTLVPGTRKVIQLDGREQAIGDVFGAAVFTRKGAVHQEEGTSDPPTRKIVIVLK
jgi:hypothetical protein